MMKKNNEFAGISVWSYLFEDSQEVQESEKLSNLDESTDDNVKNALVEATAERRLARRGITINEKKRVEFDCNVFADYCLNRVKCFIMNGIWYIYNQNTGIYDAVEDILIQKVLKYVFDEHGTSYWKPSWESQYYQAFKLVVAFLKEIPNYPTRLCFTNGVVDLIDGSVSERIFSAIHTLQVPYDYDSTADCPNFKAFISEIMDGDAERVAVIQEIMGYCLFKDVKIHKLFIFLGNGSNGKSLLCNVIGAMLGKKNTSGVLLETIGRDKFAKQNLDGKLANISAEGEGIKFNNVSELKLLTAGDIVEVEKKFKQSYTTTISAKFILCTNTMFTTTDTSDGFYRRLLIVPFNQHYVELKANEEPVEGVSYIDIELEARLLGELQGIMNWAIEGFQRLHSNGFKMTPSTACDEALAKYRKDNNAIESFADDSIVVCHDSDTRVKRSLVYSRFKSYLMDNGMSYHKVGRKEFLEELRKYLRTKNYVWSEHKSNGDYYIDGISLLD